MPQALQALHARFARAASLQKAEEGEREWSPEYFAKWYAHPQTELLDSRPLVVITRGISGSPKDGDIEAQRLRSHAELLSLSSNAIQVVVNAGHDLQLEAPDTVVGAVHMVVMAIRSGRPVTGLLLAP